MRGRSAFFGLDLGMGDISLQAAMPLSSHVIDLHSPRLPPTYKHPVPTGIAPAVLLCCCCVEVWDLNKGFSSRSLLYPKMPTALTLSMDGQTIITGQSSTNMSPATGSLDWSITTTCSHASMTCTAAVACS